MSNWMADPVRECIDLLPRKISGSQFEICMSYGYFKLWTSNIQVKAEAEVKIEVRSK